MRFIDYLELRIKTIILAGGLGTRIMEETESKPKPMVLIGDKPIIWHIMKIYAEQGFDDFIIATGYLHGVIEHWISELEEPWSVVALNTGLNTQTGGRIKRCMEVFASDNYFITYGDGLANVNLHELLAHHTRIDPLVTVTAVRPPARFGVLNIKDGLVSHFGEKSQADAGWINGGFFVAKPDVQNYIDGDTTLFETGPLPELAHRNLLGAYLHDGFWQPMDTLREKKFLSELAQTGNPPWLSQS